MSEHHTTAPDCGTAPVVPEREAECRQPYTWDEGVPYCDRCGLYRNTVHREALEQARSTKRRKA